LESQDKVKSKRNRIFLFIIAITIQRYA